MTVLVVDDSEIVRQRIIFALSEIQGLDVVGEATNMEEAVHAIKEANPGLVLLDIRIPGGSGIDVLKRIRKDGLKTKVLVFTNYAYPQYRKTCMDEGADFFFDKSTEFDKAIEVIKGIESHCHRSKESRLK